MSLLAERLLASQPGGSSAFTLAKKRATLALKTNVDAEGNTTAKGYEAAASFLAPFTESEDEADALEAQAAIAGYNNEAVGMKAARQRQLRSLADFKRREYDAYFSDFDLDVATFRNAPLLAMNTSEELDQLVLETVQAIQSDKENGHDTDSLEGYLQDLTGRADSMRDFSNRIQSGELGEGQFVGNFGYYVDADPDTGKVRGAAILPVGIAPPGMDERYERAPVTTTVNGAVLPVYMPAGQDAKGRKVMRAGGFSWSDDGEGFSPDNSQTRDSFQDEGSFSLDDRSVFPTVDKSRPRGSFVRAITGVDDTGNPEYGTLYYGHDGKRYRVDRDTLESLSADPTFAGKPNAYMPTISASEFQREAADADTMYHGPASYETMSRRRTAAPGMQDFGQVSTPVPSAPAAPEPNMTPAPMASRRTSFFDRTNRQNVPDAAPARGISAVIEKGKQFFRKTAV